MTEAGRIFRFSIIACSAAHPHTGGFGLADSN
jgi:hypothetical protein